MNMQLQNIRMHSVSKPCVSSNPATIDGIRSFCRLTRLLGDIRLAYVSIPTFVKTMLPAGFRDSSHGARARPILAVDFKQVFLAESEIRQVNRFYALKRQMEWMAGRLAVKVLVTAAGIAANLQSVRIEHREKGAPYLAMLPDRAISISHSNKWAVAGLAPEGRSAIGLDIEAVQTDTIDGLLNIAFSLREIDELAGADLSELFNRWTCKEAYLKYIGLGFYENLKQVEILKSGIHHRGRPIHGLMCHTAEPFPGYRMALVAEA